jgi:hypothetical protein
MRERMHAMSLTRFASYSDRHAALRGNSHPEDAMKKPTRRKPRLATAGSWLIPIALTAAAVVSIARFNGELSAHAAPQSAASPPDGMPWAQPSRQPKDGSRKGTPGGGSF